MQRYNDPPPRTPRSQRRRYEPSSPSYGPDEVAPPSPRRGDLRQPTINSFTPFSRIEDEDQLLLMFRTMRELIREDIEYAEAETIVDSLQGHQDIKDMFASLDGMEFIPSLRHMADILELINTKLEALEAQSGLEGVVASVDMSLDEIANADTDVETDAEPDAEPDTDSDDEGVARRLRF